MSSCLITKDGKKINCLSGAMHATTCKVLLKTTLSKFVRTGGIRVAEVNDYIAIEFYKPVSKKQNSIINAILRSNDYRTVILSRETITRFRPIRTLNLC